jgi:hypothetical protein
VCHADEGGENLHHGRVVPRGVKRDAFQHVDPSDPHVEVGRADLFKPPAVAVGELRFAGDVQREQSIGMRGVDGGLVRPP